MTLSAVGSNDGQILIIIRLLVCLSALSSDPMLYNGYLANYTTVGFLLASTLEVKLEENPLHFMVYS